MSGDYVSLNWFWPYQTKKFLVVIRERLKHIQIQTWQIKKTEKKDKIFHLYLYHTQQFQFISYCCIIKCLMLWRGDNYIQNLARKLTTKYYFWDYSIYVRIIHCHCFKWPHASLPVGLLILFTQPLADLSPHSSSERWQGPCEQFASAVQISISGAKYRCCRKCVCEFRQNFPDAPVLYRETIYKWVSRFQATPFSEIN